MQFCPGALIIIAFPRKNGLQFYLFFTEWIEGKNICLLLDFKSGRGFFVVRAFIL